ncbi:Outer membrane lipoprotein-sorting protein [Halogeometricum rufum]|uniref:Outer membrane lipoprotein-sorting protein n=1 Tax=Halogeometricum rufum TaxID=553469 RepID=A0A1I6HS39_9EURY|nr:sigma-E factor regulatory protein RseB domain-containing protein [Halogeometricum rufum]SFR57188.1 Outer membrane lipoprotein-sorting protein [Halogeometricum rufum]
MNSLPLGLTRRTLVALSLLCLAVPALLWTSGGAIGDASPSVDANVTERYRAVDSLTGTRTVTMRADGTVTSRHVASVTLAPGTDRRRVRFVDASDRRYGLQVSNGSTLWLHETGRNVVTAINLTGPPTESRTGLRLQALVAAAGLTDDAGRPRSVGVSPLPVLPRHTGVAPGADANASYAVEFVETDTVGGREAYVLEVAPEADGSEARYRQRLWLDTERFYPLRTQTEWSADGTRRSVTTTYANVTFDAPVPTGTFRPEVDADTTVERPDTPRTEWYRSRADLVARSSLSVPAPTVPPSFELVYATRTTGRIDGVGLRYADGGRELTVATFNYALDIDPDERDVSVGGQPATIDDGPTTSLSWNCEGYGYTVRGTGVETDRLIEVGRSVGCPA